MLLSPDRLLYIYHVFRGIFRLGQSTSLPIQLSQLEDYIICIQFDVHKAYLTPYFSEPFHSWCQKAPSTVNLPEEPYFRFSSHNLPSALNLLPLLPHQPLHLSAPTPSETPSPPSPTAQQPSSHPPHHPPSLPQRYLSATAAHWQHWWPHYPLPLHASYWYSCRWFVFRRGSRGLRWEWWCCDLGDGGLRVRFRGCCLWRWWSGGRGVREMGD